MTPSTSSSTRNVKRTSTTAGNGRNKSSHLSLHRMFESQSVKMGVMYVGGHNNNKRKPNLTMNQSNLGALTCNRRKTRERARTLKPNPKHVSSDRLGLAPIRRLNKLQTTTDTIIIDIQSTHRKKQTWRSGTFSDNFVLFPHVFILKKFL